MNQLARHPRLAMLLEFPCPLASLAAKVARRQRLAEVDRTLLNIFVSMVDSDLAGTLGWHIITPPFRRRARGWLEKVSPCFLHSCRP